MTRRCLMICLGLLTLLITSTSCKKDEKEIAPTEPLEPKVIPVAVIDTISPIVSVVGGDQSIELHSTYSELGATAKDSVDGNLTSSIAVSGIVDVNSAGSYTIVYSVKDKAGNKGLGLRNVIVKHTTNTIAGNYNVKDSCGSSSNSITFYVDNASNINANRMMVTKFGSYANAGVYFDISGSTGSVITVPSQTVLSGVPAIPHVFTGNGTISPNGKKMTITYTETVNSASATCIGIYTK